MIDELGNRYGSLIVIEKAVDKNGRGAWLCQCDCGNSKIVRGPDLRKGKITSCGCRLNSRLKTIKDLTGQVFGYLKVLERADDYYDKQNKKNVYKCECLNCHNICYKKGNNLTNGKVKSCGCLSNVLNAEKHFKNEVGNTFGDLTVIGAEYDEKDGQLKNKCRCNCGNICLVFGKDLRSGNTKSCGCKRGTFSHEAKAIEKFLKDNNVNYKKEYSFNDLNGDERPLRFDFVVFKKNKVFCCIEYNGQQHYEPIEFFGGEKAYEKQKKYDDKKINYCNEHNIQLIILPYTNTHETNLSILKNIL